MTGSSARVVVWKEGERVDEVELRGEGYFGREADCAVRLDDRAVSRKHAWFRVIEGGAVELRKKAEFGPFRVNGADLSEAVLQPGESVELGPYRLSLVAGGEGAPPQPEPVAAETDESHPSDDRAAPAPEAPEPLDLSPLPFEGELQQTIAPSSAPEPVGASPRRENTQLIEVAPSELSAPIELDGIPASPAPFSPPFEFEAPPMEIPAEPMAEQTGSGDSTTRIVDTGRIDARLVFPQGSASPSAIAIGDKEIVIGRSRSCDVALQDKKCSRRNTSIRREGGRFLVRDLDSVNGTFVNGKRVKETTLAGDDQIQVGDVVFHIRIVDSKYATEAKDAPFPEAAESPALPFEWDPAAAAAAPATPATPLPVAASWPATIQEEAAQAQQQAATGAQASAPAPTKKKTLMERYRALPQSKQLLVGALALAFVWWFLEDEPYEVAQPKPKPAATAKTAQTAAGPNEGRPIPPSFERLAADQKRFVEAQHQLAFDLYRNKDYDKAVFEVRKIFALIPDYKDAKEIERYALEGKKKLELLEEERRKKEEETRIRTLVAELSAKARLLMAKGKHDSAAKVFPEILALDPENQDVAKWQGEIEAAEIAKREREERRQLQLAINREAWELYRKALELFRAQDFAAARKGFQKVLRRQPDDAKLKKLAEEKIQESRDARDQELQAMLDDAKSREAAGEISAAFALYEKIAAEDAARSAEAEAAMKRIQDGIDDRAKVTYTEGVLAESFSDFETAKARFREILQSTPEGNLYHQRARGKLARYQTFEREPAGEASDAPR